MIELIFVIAIIVLAIINSVVQERKFKKYYKNIVELRKEIHNINEKISSKVKE